MVESFNIPLPAPCYRTIRSETSFLATGEKLVKVFGFETVSTYIPNEHRSLWDKLWGKNKIKTFTRKVPLAYKKSKFNYLDAGMTVAIESRNRYPPVSE